MGCFVRGGIKWHGMFCPGMFCPAPKAAWLKTYGSDLGYLRKKMISIIM